jgi:hypothetical protein
VTSPSAQTDRLEFAVRIAAALARGARRQTPAEIAQRNFAAEAEQIADALAKQGLFSQREIELE